MFTYPLESYNRDQLVEVFQLFSQWPNISIDACTITHSISVYVTHQGKFKIYDPLYRFRVAESGGVYAEAVVDHLMKFTFQIDNAIWEEKVELSFAAYKFYRKDEITPKIEKPKKNSICHAITE